ncbi:hypothetical protein SAMN05444678_102224 [Sphingomonas sp. YR710]|uniref:hypothetical protein n=1 Tax=Sphingomonas sp. YR710 TaxID=1882773 RepID=UPI0008824D9A|nr:hypothetical protein [Sphingomonas sp. YR710]SDC29584.1 hypothetical protein SAMN05444678_102224 [Sphingomonas sp. YR710]
MSDLKQFALFAFNDCYPSGGWGDFVDSFDTIEEAAAHGKTLPRDIRSIIDLRTGEDVTPESIW